MLTIRTCKVFSKALGEYLRQADYYSEGMKVEDLDLSKDQTLGQLFFTRRALAKAEKRIAELEQGTLRAAKDAGHLFVRTSDGGEVFDRLRQNLRAALDLSSHRCAP